MKRKAKIKLSKFEYYLSGTAFSNKEIEDNGIYNLVTKITAKARPSYKDRYDTKWEDFYLPVRRGRGEVLIPFSIFQYKKEFFIFFPNMKTIHVKKGRQKEDRIFREIFEEALSLMRNGGVTSKILEKKVPFDFRTGKIKGGYILNNLIPKKEAEDLLDMYKLHISKGLKISEISLNDYLKTAGICYRAGYKKQTEGLSPLEMYKKWADGRDGGMLSIKDWDSREDFEKWYKSGIWSGSHPFEIVFSWHRHGIHLYPPSEDYSDSYSLCVTNYAYAEDFISMVKGLIQENIPFHARDLEEVLDFLRGESYFTVNAPDEHSFIYTPSREYKKQYFRHIIWDRLKTLEYL